MDAAIPPADPRKFERGTCRGRAGVGPAAEKRQVPRRDRPGMDAGEPAGGAAAHAAGRTGAAAKNVSGAKVLGFDERV